MRDWVLSIGLEPGAYGTDSMRRKKVPNFKGKQATCARLSCCWATMMDSILHYLGVDLDDALSLSEGIDI